MRKMNERISLNRKPQKEKQIKIINSISIKGQHVISKEKKTCKHTKNNNNNNKQKQNN